MELDERLRECSNRIDALASRFVLLDPSRHSGPLGRAQAAITELEGLVTQLEAVPGQCTDTEQCTDTKQRTGVLLQGLIQDSDSDATDDLDLEEGDDAICEQAAVVQEKSLVKDEDAASDVTEDLIPDEILVQEFGEDKKHDLDRMADFDNDDFDDDFDEDMLQKLDEAEKSYIAEEEAETNEENQEQDEEENDDPTQQPTDQRYLDILKKYFGYGKFRPLQWKIINSVLNDKRDNLVIMATGYGKSLTYQFPSVFTGRTSIVVSPLISLMEDQVASLSTVNVSACFLGSAQEQMASVRRAVVRGDYRIVYMTPEFLVAANDLLMDLNKNVGIDLIAIDEAHCVSQWGHDFRSSYRQVGNIRDILPKVPVMGLTATATPEVRKDISRSLKLRSPNISCTSFDRPNLYLSVTLKSGDVAADLRRQMTRVGQKYEFEGPVIVYCPTKKAAENVHNIAKVIGVKSALYHAGLSLSVRKKAHRDFINDEVQMVVATVAFGMGIDKPDVRNIIHYGAPKDIESYYQEMGRAGRDGQKSSCHVFYSSGDFNTNRFFLQDIKNPKFLEHKKDMLSKMEGYFLTTKCRRRLILSHFENKDVTDVGGTEYCCDNCTKRAAASRLGQSVDSSADQERDFGREALDMLEAVDITGSRYGLGVPILFLMGSSAQKLPQHFHRHQRFGKAKYHNAKWWKAFGRQLVSEKYLTEQLIQGSFGSTVGLTPRGTQWLGTAQRKHSTGTTHALRLTPNLELQAEDKPKVSVTLGAQPTYESKVLPSVQTNTWISTRQAETSGGSAPAKPVNPRDRELQVGLYRKLIVLRNEVSHELNLQPHQVFSNKCLLDMAQYRPSTGPELVALEEVAEEKAGKYGHRFLNVITAYCRDNSWETNVKPSTGDSSDAKMSKSMEKLLSSLPETVAQSYRMFELEKKSLEETAFRRTLKTSTITTHLARCISVGLPIDVERIGITQRIIAMVTDVIRKPPINSDISRLTPIKEQLPDYIEFNHIKVVLAILQRQFGMTKDNNLDDQEVSTLGHDTSRSSRVATLTQQYSHPGTSGSRKIPAFARSPSLTSARSSTQGSRSQVTSPPQGSSQATGEKRKLPSWMGDKQEKSKKMKKNSLFAR